MPLEKLQRTMIRCTIFSLQYAPHWVCTLLFAVLSLVPVLLYVGLCLLYYWCKCVCVEGRERLCTYCCLQGQADGTMQRGPRDQLGKRLSMMEALILRMMLALATSRLSWQSFLCCDPTLWCGLCQMTMEASHGP